jgi:hypothetical protein
MFGIVLLFVFLPPTTLSATLIEALIANGASEFALSLQANPALLAYYLSPSVGTVFAPIDGYVNNNTGLTVGISRRDGSSDSQQNEIQTCIEQSK